MLLRAVVFTVATAVDEGLSFDTFEAAIVDDNARLGILVVVAEEVFRNEEVPVEPAVAGAAVVGNKGRVVPDDKEDKEVEDLDCEEAECAW